MADGGFRAEPQLHDRRHCPQSWPRRPFYGFRFSVLEGDEYDTAFFDKRSKFLHYLPELVVINNIEFDHADIYHSLEEIKLSFRRLTQIIPRNGLALVNADDPNCLDVVKGAPCPVKTVGFPTLPTSAFWMWRPPRTAAISRWKEPGTMYR